MPAEMRRMERQDAACAELISTEESYLEVLTTIVEVFLRPLRTWSAESDQGSAARSGGATQQEVETLFGSVETLLRVSTDLLEQLRQGAGEPAALFGRRAPCRRLHTASCAQAAPRTLPPRGLPWRALGTAPDARGRGASWRAHGAVHLGR